MGIATKIYELATEARINGKHEAADAYMTALIYVEEYLCQQKERQKKEELEREESTLALAAALVELYESRTNNTDK